MKQDSTDQPERLLEAFENPSDFTPEELKELLSEEENRKNARALLYGKEALARQNTPAPDVEQEWEKFKQQHLCNTTGVRKRKYLFPLITGLTAAACIVCFFLMQKPERQPENLIVFEASSRSQILQQDTVGGVVTLSVPRGMQQQISLPDGSTVMLNAESRLSYSIAAFGKEERKVTICGEGLFKVAKDSIRPFIVQSGHFNTRVLGTVFNVRNYDTEAPKVTLLSGAVEIVSPQKKGGLHILPGEQAVWHLQEKRCTVKDLSAADVAAWSEGEFYFDNQPLSEILCELGRWYNVSVIFKDKSCMKSCLHFKAHRNESLASVLELLNYISKQPIVLQDKAIVVGK